VRSAFDLNGAIDALELSDVGVGRSVRVRQAVNARPRVNAAGAVAVGVIGGVPRCGRLSVRRDSLRSEFRAAVDRPFFGQTIRGRNQLELAQLGLLAVRELLVGARVF
jgi:hypothetical protein